MNSVSRRRLLATAGLSLGATLASGVPAFAGQDEKRLLVVILRGGVDGLALLPPHGDPHFGKHRDLAGHPGADLDGFFGLHPELRTLRGLFQRRELTAFHAVGTPYRERSHFDAQNVLESGFDQPRGNADGWLNRAVVQRGAPTGYAMGIGIRPPLVLRGRVAVGAWAPNALPQADESTLARIAALWAEDPLLAPHIRSALEQQRMTAGLDAGIEGAGQVRRRLEPLMKGAAELMAAPDGPRVIAMDDTGWDTHTNAANRLDRKLVELEAGLELLVQGLQPVWRHTAVLVITEFGRTVSLNGNGGADHGVGGAALLFGGAVAGGRVVADWPGLGPRDLIAQRDLRPTVDLRNLYRAVLEDHMAYRGDAIGDSILPGVRRDRRLDGLFRA